MTVIPAIPRFAFERHGPFSEGEELGQAIHANLRGVGYGG